MVILNEWKELFRPVDEAPLMLIHGDTNKCPVCKGRLDDNFEQKFNKCPFCGQPFKAWS